MNHHRQTETARNLGTLIALGALMMMGFGLLALVAMVLPQVAWLVTVVFGMFLMGLFHYVTWGWWLSQRPADDEEPAE